MLKKSTVQALATMFALTLFLSFGALASNNGEKAKAGKAQTSQTNCSATTDENIVKAVKESFEADPDIKDQMPHLNVSVKKRTVKLEGWLDGKAAIDKAVALAKKTKCVRKVSHKLKEQGGGSCGAGLKPCGDTCIDKGSRCNIVLINES